MAFVSRDVAGYQGKEIELWVKPSNATGPNVADPELKQIRGAQNFNPTEEQAETRVPEMGYEAQKTIYGAATYSISCSLLIRDLVQIARLSGIDPSTAKRLIVSEFQPVNCLNWVREPGSTEIVATVCVSGFKPRTASKSLAVEANATITLDGAADIVVSVDGKANIREHLGDGSCTMFAVNETVTANDILAVENPAGQVLKDYDGYTFVTGIIDYDGVAKNGIQFDVAPEDQVKVRIIYKV